MADTPPSKQSETKPAEPKVNTETSKLTSVATDPAQTNKPANAHAEVTPAFSKQSEESTQLQPEETVDAYFERLGYSNLGEAPESAGDAAPAHAFICVVGFQDKKIVRAYKVATKADLLAAREHEQAEDSVGEILGWYEVPLTLLPNVAVIETFEIAKPT